MSPGMILFSYYYSTSVFVVYYQVKSDTVMVSARTTACLRVSTLETLVTGITNPQSVSYELVVIVSTSVVVRTTSTTMFVLSQTIVMADVTVVATAIKESIFAVYQTTGKLR